MSAVASIDRQRRAAPHNPQAEEALLGAMLLARQPIEDASEVVRPQDFYKPAHAHIYDAILGLYGAGQEVDPITVASALEREGVLEAVGGASYLTVLQAGGPAISNAKRYALLVEEDAALRRLISLGGEIAEIGYSRPTDLAEALDYVQRMFLDLNGGHADSALRSTGDLIHDSLDQLEKLSDADEAVTGMPTGFLDLDELTSGLHPGGVTVIGARPGAGKTSKALNIAAYATMIAGRTGLYRSIEMSHHEIMGRLISSTASVDSTRIRNGKLSQGDWEKIAHCVERIAAADLWVDDSASATPLDIRAQARQLQLRRGRLDFVVVDHVGLVGGPGKDEQERVANASRAFKVMAKDLNTHLIVCAQLNRGVEQRADKRPTLADLRSSGGLEQDADNVVFLYRDEMYYRDSPDQGVAEVIVAKQRNGPTGVVRLAFLGQYVKFANMARN